MLKKKVNMNPTPDMSGASTLVTGRIPGSHDALMDDLDRQIARTNSSMKRTGFEDRAVHVGEVEHVPPSAARAVNKSTVERWTSAERRIARGKKKHWQAGQYPRWQGGNQ
jgi:hypothetical protein